MDKSVVFKLRMSPEDRRILEELAERNSLSVAGLIRLLVRTEHRRVGGET